MRHGALPALIIVLVGRRQDKQLTLRSSSASTATYDEACRTNLPSLISALQAGGSLPARWPYFFLLLGSRLPYEMSLELPSVCCLARREMVLSRSTTCWPTHDACLGSRLTARAPQLVDQELVSPRQILLSVALAVREQVAMRRCSRETPLLITGGSGNAHRLGRI